MIWSLRSAAVSLLLLGLAATPTAAAPASGDTLPRAQELIDAGRLTEASELLDRIVKGRPKDAEALLLRSTVRFMEGEMELGRRDLDLALEIDSGLRQGWLNRAAVDIADSRLDEALEALERARDLDPAAVDNALNIGAVLVLMENRLAEASNQFREYLERTGGAADAYFLVASNFAMGGYAGLAIGHLQRAIELDERVRRRARTDPNFIDLTADPAFQRLLSEDTYLLPDGAHQARREFQAEYDGGRGRLLQAVMNVLQLSGRSFDPQVEVTPGWSLIWSDFRIKVAPESQQSGSVELTAPADRFSPAAWQQQSDAFFRDLTLQLARMRRPF